MDAEIAKEGASDMGRIWGIRHVRYWWLRRQLGRWLDLCDRHGLGSHVSPSDEAYLDAVWRGER